MKRAVWLRPFVSVVFVSVVFVFCAVELASGACIVSPDPCNDVGPFPVDHGELVGWFDLDANIVIRPIGDQTLSTSGLILNSTAGLLKPVPNRLAEPFQVLLQNDQNSIVYGNLEGKFPIESAGISVAGYDLDAALRQHVNPCDDLREVSSLLESADIFCTLPGDVDFDGEVGFVDFLTLSNNYGMTDAVWPNGDFNWDHIVGFSDFLLQAENFGKTIHESSGVAGVPEPSWKAMIVPFVFGLGSLLRRRQHALRFCNTRRLHTPTMSASNTH